MHLLIHNERELMIFPPPDFTQHVDTYTKVIEALRRTLAVMSSVAFKCY